MQIFKRNKRNSKKKAKHNIKYLYYYLYKNNYSLHERIIFVDDFLENNKSCKNKITILINRFKYQVLEYIEEEIIKANNKTIIKIYPSLEEIKTIANHIENIEELNNGSLRINFKSII